MSEAQRVGLYCLIDTELGSQTAAQVRDAVTALADAAFDCGDWRRGDSNYEEVYAKFDAAMLDLLTLIYELGAR